MRIQLRMALVLAAAGALGSMAVFGCSSDKPKSTLDDGSNPTFFKGGAASGASDGSVPSGDGGTATVPSGGGSTPTTDAAGSD